MLIKITNGSYQIGATYILSEINFEIKDKDRIAVVGRNGCGKTTLLRALTGETELSEGTGDEKFSYIRSSNPSIGYLRQISFNDKNLSFNDELLKVYEPILSTEKKIEKYTELLKTDQSDKTVSAYTGLLDKFEDMGGYTYKKEYLTAVSKMGFSKEDLNKKLSEFSGGQLTKIAFLKLLLSKPDVLLLDEPTNHLDINAIEWLEDYLKSYKSAFVIVSHDRMFLERTVDTVYEIEYGESRKYTGKYSDFERQKRQNYEKQLKDYEAQRNEISRLNRIIERFRYKPTKAAMAQSKIKQIERMQKIDCPNRYDLKTFKTSFVPELPTSKISLTVNGMKIGYEKVLASVGFSLDRSAKLGIIGGNGTGKSTFLKTLMGEIPPLDGSFSFAVGTKIGYFDQQMATKISSKTVLEEFWDEFPRLTETEARKALGAFVFSDEDVFKTVSDLSGGERVRLALCKMFRRCPNFLILDEPTNHMDIVGKETLENIINAYEGTVIVVSHDRYFINKIATDILSFESDKTVFHKGNYESFEIEQKSDEKEATVLKSNSEKSDTLSNKKGFYSPLKEKNKRLARINKLEKLINETEEKIRILNGQMSEPDISADYIKVQKIQSELEETEKAQLSYMQEWEQLLSDSGKE